MKWGILFTVIIQKKINLIFTLITLYFVQKLASTTNECLLSNYMIENENDKNMKLYFINQQLEQIRTTVFRQVMFAEFEK